MNVLMKKDMLEKMKKKVESMSKEHQINILKILVENNKKAINENTLGIFINLSTLPSNDIEKLQNYINSI